MIKDKFIKICMSSIIAILVFAISVGSTCFAVDLSDFTVHIEGSSEVKQIVIRDDSGKQYTDLYSVITENISPEWEDEMDYSQLYFGILYDGNVLTRSTALLNDENYGTSGQISVNVIDDWYTRYNLLSKTGMNALDDPMSVLNKDTYGVNSAKHFYEYVEAHNGEMPALVYRIGVKDESGNVTKYIDIPIVLDGSSEDAFEQLIGLKYSDFTAYKEAAGGEMVYGESGSFDEYADPNAEDSDMFGEINKFIARIFREIAFFLFNNVQGGIKGENGNKIVTIDDLVFDDFPSTSINFFDRDVDEDSITGLLKKNVTLWYTSFFKVTVVAYLVTLLYIGIRILVSVGGKAQEKYKEMLLCLGEAVLILLLFPYVLRITINIEHALVQAIKADTREAIHVASTPMTASVDIENPSIGGDNQKVAEGIASNPFKDIPKENQNYLARQANRADMEKPASIIDSFLVLVMVFQFILLLVAYYKRIFMVSFLIAIFPITMIFYPIDKVNDGKAQSFSIWTKELVINIFAQAMHAVCYVFVMGVTSAGANSNDWLLAIVGIMFLFKGDEILRNLLGAQGSMTSTSPTSSLIKAAATVGIVNRFTDSAVKTAGLASKGFRQMHQARQMGYKGGLPFFSRSQRENNVGDNFDIMADFYGENDKPTTPPVLSPETLDASNPDDLDSVTNTLKNAENEVVTPLITVNADGDQVSNPPSSLTNAASFVLQNTNNTGLAKALEDKGLTTDGMKSLRAIRKAQRDYRKGVLSLDPNDKEYNKKLNKIQEQFNATIRVAFPKGLNSTDDATKLSVAFMQAMRVDENGVGRAWNPRLNGGAGGYETFIPDEFNAAKVYDKNKKQMSKFTGPDAGININGVREGMIADKDSKQLFGFARTQRDKILDAMDNGDSATKAKFKDVSDSTKKDIAKQLAILQTFGEMSNLSDEDYENNKRALKNESLTGSAQSQARFSDRNERLQHFSAKTLEEATQKLIEYNIATGGAVDHLLTKAQRNSQGVLQQRRSWNWSKRRDFSKRITNDYGPSSY